MIALRFLLPVTAVGLALGLASAYYAANATSPFGSVAYGPWTAWPRAGTVTDDPYSRAALSISGRLPLGSGEGLAMVATNDSAGRPLHIGCTYAIEGQTPPARLWTLSLEAADGNELRATRAPQAMASTAILRQQDGSFRVTLSPRPRPGNWLATPREPFRIVIRLYDTTARTATAISSFSMPAIRPSRCA